MEGIKRRHISKDKYRIIFRSFIADIPACKTVIIAGVNRKTADYYYNLFRAVIIKAVLKEREEVKLGNGVEIDEAYFGPSRIKGKKGREEGNCFWYIKKEREDLLYPDNQSTELKGKR